MLAMTTLFHTSAHGFLPCHCIRRTIVTSNHYRIRLRDQKDDTKDMVNNLLEWTIRRAQSTLADYPSRKYASSANAATSSSSSNCSSNNNNNNQQTLTKNSGDTANNSSTTTMSQSMPKFMYRGNPAITNTALAHSLWATILRPNIDTAIDATCGNGHDSVVLARLLFPETPEVSLSRLMCIDIQERACQNTEQALRKDYSDLLDSGRIQVLHQSHAPLPIDGLLSVDDNDKDFLSIALVVYNLGWLPNNAETTTKEDCITQMETTLQSMVDAMLVLRIGGMLSVVTYPKTNAQEDLAVRTFLECAALLSSNIQTWQDFLESALASESSDGTKDQSTIYQMVNLSMKRLVEQGDDCQTWRVSEHKKLGMDRAPILLTATRIK